MSKSSLNCCSIIYTYYHSSIPGLLNSTKNKIATSTIGNTDNCLCNIR